MSLVTGSCVKSFWYFRHSWAQCMHTIAYSSILYLQMKKNNWFVIWLRIFHNLFIWFAKPASHRIRDQFVPHFRLNYGYMQNYYNFFWKSNFASFKFSYVMYAKQRWLLKAHLVADVIPNFMKNVVQDVGSRKIWRLKVDIREFPRFKSNIRFQYQKWPQVSQERNEIFHEKWLKSKMGPVITKENLFSTDRFRS